MIDQTIPAVHGTDPIWKVSEFMKAAQLNELPVLSDQHFIGMIHAKDLLMIDSNQSIDKYIDKKCVIIDDSQEFYRLPLSPQVLPVVKDGIYCGSIRNEKLCQHIQNQLNQLLQDKDLFCVDGEDFILHKNKTFEQEIMLSNNKVIGIGKAGLSNKSKSKQHFKNSKEKSKIIACSQEMKEIFSLVKHVASSSSTVLLLGESGVGKEVIAKMLHENSFRVKKDSFMKVNCGAIPQNLLESELFGYEQGAFTGAKTGGKIGVFELVDNGTLFLDEIGELPLDMQVKLLRVLQDQEIRRVGGTQTIKVNVRIIAATNRNLEKMVENGTFRADLYYRLNIVPFRIPPLRERKNDIIPLLRHFIAQFNEKYQYTKHLSKEAENQLLLYHYPGNVRELSNIVERLVLTCREDVIERYHLPSHLSKCRKMGEISKIPQDDLKGDLDIFKHYWENPADGVNMFNRLEKRALIKALRKYGSVRKTGKAIGVPHTLVLNKMKQFGINAREIL